MADKLLTVAGLDPSLRNFGMVKGVLNLMSGTFTISKMEIQETAADSRNKAVRKNTQDLHRARLITQAMNSFLIGVDMVFVEIPVGSQTARAMTSYGICIGVLSSVTCSMIQVTPSEVKVAATGNKVATKAEMITWATGRYPDADWLTKKQKGVLSFIDKNEHLADALAAIHAGVKTDEFNQARTMLNR